MQGHVTDRRERNLDRQPSRAVLKELKHALGGTHRRDVVHDGVVALAQDHPLERDRGVDVDVLHTRIPQEGNEGSRHAALVQPPHQALVEGEFRDTLAGHPDSLHVEHAPPFHFDAVGESPLNLPLAGIALVRRQDAGKAHSQPGVHDHAGWLLLLHLAPYGMNERSLPRGEAAHSKGGHDQLEQIRLAGERARFVPADELVEDLGCDLVALEVRVLHHEQLHQDVKAPVLQNLFGHLRVLAHPVEDPKGAERQLLRAA
mmetsp:Transcript_15247/g.36284  ORF Transcript_15247/g.36284 Transcript_15247/m.36284 type:complete len:259 (+) Transcript_15247:283-1059(+)